MKPLSTALSLGVFYAVMLCSCDVVSPYNKEPLGPDDGDSGRAEGPWEEVLNGDPAYPDNVYLTALIEFHPGPAGSARTGDLTRYDESGYPRENLGALGPPEGSYPSTHSNSEADMTVLGSGGWAVWRFDPRYAIVNGPGDDFRTFSNHNVLSGNPDHSWNELARVYISENGSDWYENSDLTYTSHPSPGTASSAYDWDAVKGLHGNTHSWANFRIETGAEHRDSSSGLYEDLLGPGAEPLTISRYFNGETEHMGGDSFDLEAFIHCNSGVPWPVAGKMRYLKIVDDPAIVDGQDWNPHWMTGARIMSAMGINTISEGSAP